MQRILISALLLFFVLPIPSQGFWQEAATPTVTPTVTILSPATGQALQGSVPITGNTAVQDFQTAELAFAYQNNPTDTWFVISQAAGPVANGALAQWDTTTISDGIYILRLVVTLSDGQQISTLIPGLRVRNYTPIETSTPAPATPTTTQAPGKTPTLIPTLTIAPSATPLLSTPVPAPLPGNPAQLSAQDIFIQIGRGALLAAGLFALLGLYKLLYDRRK